MKVIPYSCQDISQLDVDAVAAVLRAECLTQGPLVPAFEVSVVHHCAAKYAVAVNSATSALHIACLALGIGPGDIVWTTPITFVATANCALYCGAAVDFVDIDSRTYNLSVDRLAEKLAATKEDHLPKVVIPVHLAGQPCDMAGIHALSQQYGFRIIEDASHAIGGKYQGAAIGNGRYADITIFSFHPVKIITSGEGGMATTNDAEVARRLRLLRSHGISSEPEYMESRAKGEIWNYQQIALGFNYRMSDIHAALGLSQMGRLDEFVAKRHSIARRYDQLLATLPVTIPWQHPDGYSAFHLYVIRLQSNTSGKTQRQVYDVLRAAGILVNLHYIPVYRHPYYERMGFSADNYPEAEKYYAQAISLPLYPSLTFEEQDYVVRVLRETIES